MFPYNSFQDCHLKPLGHCTIFIPLVKHTLSSFISELSASNTEDTVAYPIIQGRSSSPYDTLVHCPAGLNQLILGIMPLTGLEPARLMACAPKAHVSAYSTIRAKSDEFMGFPPSTGLVVALPTHNAILQLTHI